MFPEGETTTLGFEGEGLCLVPLFECVEPVGEGAGPSTGVGGVTKVVGASTVLGGVAGRSVTMSFGPSERSEGVDCVSEPVWMCNDGEAATGSSEIFWPLFLPPNNEPIPPALVPDLTLSVSAPGLGEVVRRVGLKASFSLPTGETPRLLGAVSLALGDLAGPSSVEVSESTRVASVAVVAVVAVVVVVAEASESMVSEAIRGEERVSRPAWEWCGDIPGRRTGELIGDGQSQRTGGGRECRESRQRTRKEEREQRRGYHKGRVVETGGRKTKGARARVRRA